MRVLFEGTGYWTWWIIAAILLVLELVVPGIFFLWLGLAAAAVGLIALLLVLPWQAEVAIFGALAVALIFIARPWLEKRNLEETDQPNLNRRLFNYIGRDYVLDRPIENGQGRLRIEDTLWAVEGPDLPAGSWVRVTGVDGLKLKVEPTTRRAATNAAQEGRTG
jgi:membrane protein implicated in regulation of membrane protease activity